MLASTHVGAQSPCSGDSLALQVAVTTDAWGYEAYWELLPLNGACGSDEAMLWGGNPDVGCADGVPGLPGAVYGNNGVFVSEVACVAAGDSLTLFHRDSYGDGGTDFIVLVGGIELGVYDGTEGGNEWTFAAMAPEVVLADAPCFAPTIEADGEHWIGSNVDATASALEVGPPGLGCGTFGGWCEGGLSNTVWLAWEVPANGGVYRISTCNELTSFDTQLALWRAESCFDWSSFELLNANDDAGCEWGAFRSTLLTPCLEGGETLLIQIDGYYGETGDLEVSVQSSAPELWAVNGNASNLSCNLDGAFNPDGQISVNPNVGAASVEWNWSGPFGFSSEEASIGPLFPGVYELEAEFCGVTQNQTFEVLEPAPVSVDVLLSPNCETAAMQGSALVNGAQGEVTVIWEVDGEQYESGEVSDLPPGLCTVSVEDALGCEAFTVVLVDAVGVPAVDLGEDQMGCVGEPISLLAPLGAGLSYQWTTGDSGPLLVVTPEATGTIVVGVEVTDETGCSGSDAVILTIADCDTDGVSSASVNALRAMPNPFVETLTIQASPATMAQDLMLFNAIGEAVRVDWEKVERGFRLTTEVAPGAYVLLDQSQGARLTVVAR